MTHTPGPWTKQREQDSRGWFCWSISSPTVARIAVLTYGTAGERADGIDDACLIEAAPDLFSNLCILSSHIAALIASSPEALEHQPGLKISLADANKAIKKATFGA